jgi:hypothetical protein
MLNSNVPTLRRSSRVPARGSDTGYQFGSASQTSPKSARPWRSARMAARCGLPMRLEAGVPHALPQPGGPRDDGASCLAASRLNPNRQSWTLGARFDRPAKFLGVAGLSERLGKTADDRRGKRRYRRSHLPTSFRPIRPPPLRRIVLDRIKKQLSDERLKAVLAELVHPLEAEMADLREKLAQGAKRSRFEVSLSQIPPELEQQLELRPEDGVGAPGPEAAHRSSPSKYWKRPKQPSTRGRRKPMAEFLRRVALDLQAVEQRTPGLLDRRRSESAGAPESWTGRASPARRRRRQPPQANEREDLLLSDGA